MSIFKLGDFSDSNIVTRKKWTGSFGGFGGGEIYKLLLFSTVINNDSLYKRTSVK